MPLNDPSGVFIVQRLDRDVLASILPLVSFVVVAVGEKGDIS